MSRDRPVPEGKNRARRGNNAGILPCVEHGQGRPDATLAQPTQPDPQTPTTDEQRHAPHLSPFPLPRSALDGISDRRRFRKGATEQPVW